MNKVTAVLIFCGVLCSTLGDFRDWWKRDEDTIEKKVVEYRDSWKNNEGTIENIVHGVVIEKAQIEAHHVNDGKKEDGSNIHKEINKHGDEHDDCGGHDNDENKDGSKDMFKMSGYITCDGGAVICYESDAYCCHLSGGTVGCCRNAYVYQLWWFWMIWIIFFFLILACSLACWRRRTAQYRYVVMANSEYPSYGTVVHARGTDVRYIPPPGYQPNSVPAGAALPNAPMGPPSYTGSEKPPAYNN